ncbi:MAG TPA: proline--tRNA ligase [Blastocatellia bacterium]|nr:proline--tRNA ligase [Blastocatellia bacterium]
MRWSQYFIPTLREDPADAEVVSHKLLLRAGLIRQVGSGIYSYLPLAQRSILKISEIIRQEMNAVGGQEFFLPVLHPAELWQESGRWSVMGDNMFRLKDRKGGDYCLGMTHEEVMTDIARKELQSYKQLPQVWYQIQTKFRDEPRPKSGLLRVRQFTMKDAYSFDVDSAGLDRSFEDQRRAYSRIYKRCGLDFVIVEADSGSMGGSASNEFMVYTDAGEDMVASCPQCGYAANTERAQSRIPAVDDGQAQQSLEKFPTPGIRTIEALVNFPDGAPADRQIKTLVYVSVAQKGKEEKNFPFLALLRGDHPFNEVKLAGAIARLIRQEGWEQVAVRPAHPEEIFELMGANAGSLGAVGKTNVWVVADEALRGRRNMTTGANEDDYHLRGVSLERDIKVTVWADLRTVAAGEGCPKCEGVLRVAKALEVGHIFKLGTKYSESMGANVLTAGGKPTPLIMGCYGIGVERILAAAIELHHDESGIIFPLTITPFQVVVSPLNMKDADLKSTAERIYEGLGKVGIEAIYDDRDERAGVKLNDADLVGFPYQIRIGAKKLKEGKVEFYDRTTRLSEDVTADAAVELAGQTIYQMMRRLNEI